jgi:chemotaxis protein CheD
MSTIILGVGGYTVSSKPGEQIKTMGLGSCVAMVIIARNIDLAAMVHVALPESFIDEQKSCELPGYFADTAIPVVLESMKKHGVTKSSDMIIKLVGGANVMDPENRFNIGKRNVLHLRKLLWQNHLAPRAEDVGGAISRTVWIEVGSEDVYVSSPGKGKWVI